MKKCTTCQDASGLIEKLAEADLPTNCCPECGASLSTPETEEAELHLKCVKAARAFLEHKGYEVVDEDCFGIDLVARRENGNIAVIDLDEGDGYLPEQEYSDSYRMQMEEAAAKWLAENGTDSVRIEFDRLAINLIGEHRGFVRFIRNCMNAA